MAKAPTLARSSAVMFMGTLASRMLGLVRNAMLVAALGAPDRAPLTPSRWPITRPP